MIVLAIGLTIGCSNRRDKKRGPRHSLMIELADDFSIQPLESYPE